MNYFSIGVFGALGAATRYTVGLFAAGMSFPAGTLVVNIMGCFLLAFIAETLKKFSSVPDWLANGLGTGFVGAFTTFSAFSVENAGMILDGDYSTAAIYITSSLLLGVLSAGSGIAAGKNAYKWNRRRRVMRFVRSVYLSAGIQPEAGGEKDGN